MDEGFGGFMCGLLLGGIVGACVIGGCSMQTIKNEIIEKGAGEYQADSKTGNVTFVIFDQKNKKPDKAEKEN